MSADLNRVAVLRTMIERRVQPLKRRALLLCDYARVEDPIHKVEEDLESDVVVEWVDGLVGVGIIVATENAIVAFSVCYHPNLVSHPFLLSNVGISHVSVDTACSSSLFYCLAPASTFPIPGALSAPPRRRWPPMNKSAFS